LTERCRTSGSTSRSRARSSGTRPSGESVTTCDRQHEDILYCWKGTPPKPREAISDVWTHARPSAPVNAAEKPVDLSQTAITFASPRGGLVVDVFAGVGNILIACSRTGRWCHLMEFEPQYCDVIVQRWEAFTGQIAERIRAAIAV
jgi:DNA modification methylase